MEEHTGRVGGVDLFGDVIHVGLRGPGGVPLRNMYCQGFGEIIIQRMQILEESTRRVGELTCLKILCMWDCEALEEFPSRIWTLEAL